MNSSKETIINFFFRGEEFLPSRLESFLRALEKALAPVKFNYTLSDTAVPQLIRNREAWIEERFSGGPFPIISNGEEMPYASMMFVVLPSFICPGQEAMLEVSLSLPSIAPYETRLPELMRMSAPELDTLWATALPPSALPILKQIVHPAMSSEVPEGLPSLQQGMFLTSPAQPFHAGWIQYWSAETCAYLGFTASAKQKAFFHQALPSPHGGWVLQLTEKPLDLGVPAHLQALAALYTQYPLLGKNA